MEILVASFFNFFILKNTEIKKNKEQISRKCFNNQTGGLN